jgi:TonB-linked SusC/RagA family outer membrane protein
MNGFAQIDLKGQVKDETGAMLPGVNVIVKGTSTGTVTDIEGKYSLKVEDKNAVIVFTSIGFSKIEMPVGDKVVIDVTMKEDRVGLDEVVVVGYGTLDKKELTSAVTHISSDELLATTNANPIMAIQGQVSGLSVANTSGSDPNASASVQMRGVSSTAGSNTPLYVIDGIPGGNIMNLNPEDIQSIDVLKDGAASAIYGTRAGNGVIVITTKKGKSGTSQATYTSTLSLDFIKDEPDTYSAEEFRQLIKDGKINASDLGGNDDWTKATRDDYGIVKTHAISLVGGTESFQYRASMDYKDADGIDLKSGREEYGARLAVTHKGHKGWYEINVTAAPRKVDYENSNGGAISKSYFINPTTPIKDAKGNYKFVSSGTNDYYNLVEKQLLEQSGGERNYLDWSTKIKVNPLKGLSSEISISQSFNDNYSHWFLPARYTNNVKNDIKGEASRKYQAWDQKNLEWVTNYSGVFGKHSFRAMGGYSQTLTTSSHIDMRNRDFTSDATTYHHMSNGQYQKEEGRTGFGSGKEDSKLVSYFGRVNYNFDGKYIFSASIRREGSSKFGENNKWGNFPAASIGWRLSEEPFMAPFKSIVNELKIRADYGVTGNQPYANYISITRLRSYSDFFFNGTKYPAWGVDGNPNPDLKWEEGENMNIGIDFGVLDNKISGSVNYYKRKQVDLISSGIPVDQLSHVSDSKTVNVGSIENSGLEIDLNIQAYKRGDFSYDLNLVASTNENIFLSFSNDLYQGQKYMKGASMPSNPGSPGPSQRIEEGKRLGNFFIYESAGIDKNGNMLIYNKDGKIIKAEFGTDEDKKVMGNGSPKFNLGMGHKFRYKEFDLTLQFRGAFGFQMMDVNEMYYGLPSSPEAENKLKTAFNENIQIKGDKYLTSYFLRDADYLKLAELTFGYNLDLKNEYVKSMRLYTTGKNLFTLTPFTGRDPERVNPNGLWPGHNGSKDYYPTTMQLILGVQIKF